MKQKWSWEIFNYIKKTIVEIENLMEDSELFQATKNFLEKTARELNKGNIKLALDNVNKAKECAIREKVLIEKIKGLHGLMWKDGYSGRIYNALMKKMKEGKIDEAEKSLQELEKSIKMEKEILSKIGEVKTLIKKNMVGSNPQEAEKYCGECIKFLKKGDFKKAEECVSKARIVAGPSLKYLIEAARRYYEDGLKKFEEEKFEESINLWKNSIKNYEKVKEMAAEMKDEAIIKNADEVLLKIKKYISESEISIDNRTMVKIVDGVDKKIETANELMEKHKYDDAVSILLQSLKEIKKALNIAKKRNFEEDRRRIMKRIENIKMSIDFVRLEKGRYLLENAVKNVKTDGKKAEKELYDILDYLNSLDIDSDDLEYLKENCKKAIIEGRIRIAERNMKKAEELYKEGKYYDAREMYQKVHDYLIDVEDKAGELRVKNAIEDIRKIRSACIENIDSCNSQLFNLPDAPERKLIVVKETREFFIPVRNKISLFPGDKEKLTKLRRDYEIIDYLGGGGFADVYKARWKAKKMIVALKIPRELTPSAEEIFFNEIRKWEELDHRNIVKLIKPRVSPVPHLIVEYIDGKTLFQVMEKGCIPIDKACRIAFDVARGLEYAHKKFIIHCDLKPKNILISKIGEGKITDFGIAKTVATSSKEGVKGLTLIYAAPEQLDMKADERTDIYQLGLIFYQMITGINPFDVGSREDIERKIREELPEPPSTYNSDAKPLDDIIIRCLSKNPDERPKMREIKETIYAYMKKYHGKSLHLTEDRKDYIKLAITHAFYAAKHNDLSECIYYLKLAEERIMDSGLRNRLGNLIKQLEIMESEKIEIGDGTLNDLGMILKDFA